MRGFISGVLLVIGSIIGGGMVAIPVITAGMSMNRVILTILGCWVIMTATGLMILHLCMHCKPENNTYYSIVGRYLGLRAQRFSTGCFALLLYFNLSSYSSGIASLGLSGFSLSSDSRWYYAICLGVVLVAAGFLSLKRRWLLNSNMLLVSIKLLLLVWVILTCFARIVPLGFHSHLVNDTRLFSVVMVILNAFGFHFIVPTIVTSYGRKSRFYYSMILITGTFLVCVLYLCWLWSIRSIIPMEGAQGLIAVQNSVNQLLALNHSITYFVQSTTAGLALRLFQVISIVGSFLCVGLGLMDFMKDRFNTTNPYKIATVTFLPPLILTFMSQNMYLKAMVASGYLALLLEILIPIAACMVALNRNPRYRLGYAALSTECSAIQEKRKWFPIKQ